jgi:uncharacterized membrane protein
MFFKDEKGQALYLAAVGMLALMAFVGLGIDTGVLRYQKRMLQSAADAAAVAAANNLAYVGACTVEVTVCYDYKFIFPLMPAGSSTKCPGSSTTGATLTLSSTSEMIIAH